MGGRGAVLTSAGGSPPTVSTSPIERSPPTAPKSSIERSPPTVSTSPISRSSSVAACGALTSASVTACISSSSNAPTIVLGSTVRSVEIPVDFTRSTLFWSENHCRSLLDAPKSVSQKSNGRFFILSNSFVFIPYSSSRIRANSSVSNLPFVKLS